MKMHRVILRPVNGIKCSCGKISSPLTEVRVKKKRDLGNQASPSSHIKVLKLLQRVRGEARSWKPGQLGQPGTYEA